MNGEDKKDLKVILEKMERAEKDREDMSEAIKTLPTMQTDIATIYKVLLGSKDDRSDLGLVGDVRENTEFRNSAKYWLRALGGVNIGIGLKMIWDVVTKRGT